MYLDRLNSLDTALSKIENAAAELAEGKWTRQMPILEHSPQRPEWESRAKMIVAHIHTLHGQIERRADDIAEKTIVGDKRLPFAAADAVQFVATEMNQLLNEMEAALPRQVERDKFRHNVKPVRRALLRILPRLWQDMSAPPSLW